MARKQPEGTTLLDGPGRWREIEGRITGIRVIDDCFSNGGGKKRESESEADEGKR